MKKYVDIYIDGQKVDVDVEGLSLAVEYSIEETELGKIRGANSKRSITLPPTKNNAVIAEIIYEPGSSATSAGYLQTARVEVNGLPVLAGRAQLTNVDLARRGHGLRAAGYKYALYGSNADWFQSLGDLRIRDLAWTDTTITTTGIEATYAPADEYCFTVIKWAEWYQSSAVRHVDHTPALFVSAILEKSFNSIGYTFSSLFGSDPWNRLIIPVPLNLDGEYANQQVNIRVESSAAQLIPVVAATPTDTEIEHGKESPDPNRDPGDRYNEVGHTYTNSYKCPIKGFYRVKGTITVTGFIQSIAPEEQLFEVRLLKNNTVIATVTIYDTNSSYTDGGNGIHPFQHVDTFDAGDELQFVARTNSDTATYDFYVTSIFEVEFEKDQWYLGDPIPWKYIIPLEWKVRDMISDLTRIFNLKWETDVQAATVNTWPADYYYLTYRADATGATTTAANDGFFYQSSATNMSRFWDVSKGGELSLITNQKRDYVLDWATDDETTQSIEQAKGVSLYSARYRFPANRFPEGEDRTRTQWFAKVIHFPASDVYHSSSTDFVPQIPLVYPEDFQNTTAAEPDYDTSPRLLYYAGRRNGYDGYLTIYNEQTSASSAYDFPAAFMVNYNDPSGVDVSLSFCDETTNSGNTVLGLLTRFHINALKRIEVGKQYEVFLYWDELDLSDLSFRYKVELEGDKYILQSIDGYNPLKNDSTKTRLLLDVTPSQNDADTKVSGPVGPGESAVTGGSGGAGAYLGGAVIAGSESGFYEQVFTAPVPATIEITVNGGTLPSNKAQIWVYANGQYVDSSNYSVTNIDGANDQITFTNTPVSVVNITVRFRYP